MEDNLLDVEWAVGYRDRGHGHGDFAVIVKGTEELVVEASSRGLADHLVEAHNEWLNAPVPESFTCPRCDAHHWGTSRPSGISSTSKWLVHCNGPPGGPGCGWVGAYEEHVKNG